MWLTHINSFNFQIFFFWKIFFADPPTRFFDRPATRNKLFPKAALLYFLLHADSKIKIFWFLQYKVVSYICFWLYTGFKSLWLILVSFLFLVLQYIFLSILIEIMSLPKLIFLTFPHVTLCHLYSWPPSTNVITNKVSKLWWF